MDQAITRKLQYKEGDHPYYCLELPATYLAGSQI